MMTDRLEGLTNFSNNKERTEFDDFEFTQQDWLLIPADYLESDDGDNDASY